MKTKSGVDIFTSCWRLVRRWKHYPYLAYQAIALVSRRSRDWQLMNYGYSPMDGSKMSLAEGTPEEERYSLQLYHFMAEGAHLSGERLLEIGSGRGGGAAYVHRAFGLLSTTGLDFSGRQVAFCRSVHRLKGLSFVQGNAQALPFDGGSFGAVLNIESSHNYPDCDLFYREVLRVLKPGGAFLYSDVFMEGRYEALPVALEKAGFDVLENREINPEVMASLELDNGRRQKLADDIAPLCFRKFARLFAGTTDSYGYRKLVTGQSRYFRVIARKPLA